MQGSNSRLNAEYIITSPHTAGHMLCGRYELKIFYTLQCFKYLTTVPHPCSQNIVLLASLLHRVDQLTWSAGDERLELLIINL